MTEERIEAVIARVRVESSLRHAPYWIARLAEDALRLADECEKLMAENERLQRPRYCETFQAYGYPCEPPANEGTHDDD